MEPESSLPHSQQSTAYPYPESDQLSPNSPSYFLKVHFNIILPSTKGLPIGLFPLGFPNSILYISSILPHTCYMPLPTHSSWFDHSNNVWWGVQIKKFSCHFFQYFIPLRPLCLSVCLSIPFSNILRLRSSLIKRDQVSHSYKTTGKIIVLYILFYFLQ